MFLRIQLQTFVDLNLMFYLLVAVAVAVAGLLTFLAAQIILAVDVVKNCVCVFLMRPHKFLGHLEQ